MYSQEEYSSTEQLKSISHRDRLSYKMHKANPPSSNAVSRINPRIRSIPSTGIASSASFIRMGSGSKKKNQAEQTNEQNAETPAPSLGNSKRLFELITNGNYGTISKPNEQKSMKSSDRLLKLLPKESLPVSPKRISTGDSWPDPKQASIGGNSFKNRPYLVQSQDLRSSVPAGCSKSASKLAPPRFFMPSDMIRESFNRRSAERAAQHSNQQKLNQTVGTVQHSSDLVTTVTQLERKVMLLEADNTNLRRILSETVRNHQELLAETASKFADEKKVLFDRLSSVQHEHMLLANLNNRLIQEKARVQEHLNSELSRQLQQMKFVVQTVDKHLSEWERLLASQAAEDCQCWDHSPNDTREVSILEPKLHKEGFVSPPAEREKRVRWTDQTLTDTRPSADCDPSVLCTRLAAVDARLKRLPMLQSVCR